MKTIIDMQIYKVECVCRTSLSSGGTSMEIFVVAENEAQASEKALDFMKAKKWKYDDYVRSVVCIASSNPYAAEAPAVI